LVRCTKCILPESYPGISFDDSGVCSVCRGSRGKPPALPGEEALMEAVAPYRGSGRLWDCTVAFSGGRDSTYILWYTVRKLGMKPLAICTDNGFVPEHTYRNVRRTADTLGVELRIEGYPTVRKTFPGMLRAWMRRPSAATVGLLCTGCCWGRRLILPRISTELRIPLMMVGGGEPERSFAEPLLVRPGREVTRLNLIRGSLRQFARNPGLLLSPRRLLSLVQEYSMRYMERRILRLRKFAYPSRKVFPYLYMGWDEAVIMDTIVGELGWEKGTICGTPWRSDCLIAPLRNYMYGKLLGFHKVDELLAGMARDGLIDRDTALERLPGESVVDEGYLDRFLSRFGTSLRELDRAIEEAPGPV
jgi:hypothetical protein